MVAVVALLTLPPPSSRRWRGAAAALLLRAGARQPLGTVEAKQRRRNDGEDGKTAGSASPARRAAYLRREERGVPAFLQDATVARSPHPSTPRTSTRKGAEQEGALLVPERNVVVAELAATEEEGGPTLGS